MKAFLETFKKEKCLICKCRIDNYYMSLIVFFIKGKGPLNAVYVLKYSKTCVRQTPLKLTLVVDVERWLSYKGTCHVILLAKLHDMYLYKTHNFFHINQYLKSVSKVALLHWFYCIQLKRTSSLAQI